MSFQLILPKTRREGRTVMIPASGREMEVAFRKVDAGDVYIITVDADGGKQSVEKSASDLYKRALKGDKVNITEDDFAMVDLLLSKYPSWNISTLARVGQRTIKSIQERKTKTIFTGTRARLKKLFEEVSE